MSPSRRPLRARFWPIAATLLATALRAHDLAGQSLWSDEDITLDRARTALGAMLAGLPSEHAPLYFVVLRGWTHLAGDGDFALRFPSLLAGVLAVPLAYAVARRLTDRPTAVATALLFAVNPFLVSYGQEARMYALVGALTLAALAAALAADARTRAGRPVRSLWLACGALTAATVYTHYYGVLLAATLAAWGLPDVVAWARRIRSDRADAARRRAGETTLAARRDDATRPARARGWLTAGAVAAALFAPWLPRALRVADHPGWRADLPLWRVPDTLAVAWSAQTGVTAGRAPGGWAIAATALAVALLAIGVAAGVGRARGGTGSGGIDADADVDVDADTTGRLGARRALAWLLAMAVVAGIALIRKPDYHPRYLYPFLGVWFMAVAAGASVVARRLRAVGALGWLPLAVLVALFVPTLAGYYTDPAQRKTDYRRLVATVLDAAPADRSRLFLDGPSLGIAERYVPAGADLKIENLRSEKNAALHRDGPAAFEARVEDLATRRPNAWLATDGAAEHGADGWLAANAYPVASMAVGDVTLERWYVPPPTGATRPARGVMPAFERMPDGSDPNVRPTPPLALVTFEGAIPSRVRAGDVWSIALLWRPRRFDAADPPWSASLPAQRRHRVSVRLVNPSGTVVASADREPAAGTAPTTAWTTREPIVDHHGLLVPASTPPGPYQLTVVLYDAETLAPAYTWSHVAEVTVEPAP